MGVEARDREKNEKRRKGRDREKEEVENFQREGRKSK